MRSGHAIFPLALAFTAAAFAAPPPKAQSAYAQMSLEGAVQQVQQQTNGRILTADSIPNGRNKIYRIKVLTPDGHVKVMQLHSNDTPSGKLPNKKRDGSGGH
ncbi:MAG: hypothetical protein C4338_04775 [Rhodanobacteraceae bacterium]